MFIGCPIAAAFFSAAAITLRASANVTIFFLSPCIFDWYCVGLSTGPLGPQQLYIIHFRRSLPKGVVNLPVDLTRVRIVGSSQSPAIRPGQK